MKQHDVNTSFAQQARFKLSPLTLIIAGLGLSFQPLTFAAESNSAAIINNKQINPSQQYSVQAGSLSQVLSEFAGQAGIALSFKAVDFNKIESSGLQGRYTVEQGFIKLFSATTYRVEKQGNGSYIIKKTLRQR